MGKTWQVVLAVAALFASGVIFGSAISLGVEHYLHHRPHPPEGAAPKQAPKVEPFGPQLMRNFINKLDLSEEQKIRIAPIVRRTANQLARDRREVQLRAALTIEQMQDEIARQLTPEQRGRFEELIARQRERLQELRHAPPVPNDPTPPPPPAPK